MINKYNTSNIYDGKNAILSAVVLVLVLFGGIAFIGPILGFGYLVLTSNLGLSEIQQAISDPFSFPELKTPIMVFQGLNALGTFIIAPALFFGFYLKKPFSSLFQKTDYRGLLLVLLLTASFMVINTIFIDLNSQMALPSFMSGLEQWATRLEKQMEELTRYLTEMDSAAYFILSIFVIALIPAVGEELVFRGLVQNVVLKGSKNIHVAIWVSAFIFGFIHFQFYGLIPRMMLGALFGYFYAYTGNLTFPILGHFINNGLSLFLVYFYQKGHIDYDVESADMAPWSSIVIFISIFLAGFYVFHKTYISKDSGNGQLAEDI